MKTGSKQVIRRIAFRSLGEKRSNTFFTIAAIALSTAMILATAGFAVSGRKMVLDATEKDVLESGQYFAMIYGLAGVIGAIIVATSVIIASNAFRVSAGERIKQFGLLKSIGATKAEIEYLVIYEGVLLCAIGIPTGGLLGNAIHFIGASIVERAFNEMTASGMVMESGTGLHFYYVFSWEATLLAALVAFCTVIFSAWLPARKVAKITAIDAMRQREKRVVTDKSVRIFPVVQRLFGCEGMLAAKYVKLNRRSFRATVAVLSASIVLFMVGSYFGDLIETSLAIELPDSDKVTGQKAFVLAIRFFVIGFVTLLTLIAATNVVSTIITNMRLRAREIALLRGIGMSKRNFAKMLTYESAMSFINALLIGVFLGSALVAFLYVDSMQSAEFPFEYPWVSVIISAVGVLVVMSGATVIAARSTNSESIVHQ
ncbi:MAG: FtsX-like permease family protein [Bifidobacteriaceae bacterium]|jgi:ABC-type antimicrobial peptide transport system permease subunit|nr:FtsX-like permease family protein [Bifidobacteriaceae bacterium]